MISRTSTDRTERSKIRPVLGLGAQSSLLSPLYRILTVVVLAGIYAPVFTDLARIWWRDTYAVHGLFVPFFSALMLWNDRERLREASGRGEPAGFLLILLGLGVLVLGGWTENLIVQGLSVPLSVAGLVVLCFGKRCLRAAAFPVAFLFLMVPPPRLLISAVTVDLQLFAAGFAGAALGLFGIPFYQSGLFIELPAITLEIAEICNGLRFTLALLVLTIAFAQVSQHTLTRKLVLVAAAIPFAILANAVRVTTVVVAVHYWGIQAASGFIHNSIGKGVWALTLIPLVALGLIMRRRQ